MKSTILRIALSAGVLSVIAILTFRGCSSAPKSGDSAVAPVKETPNTATPGAAPPSSAIPDDTEPSAVPAVQYTIETGRVEMAVLRKRFTPEQMAVLEKLNRADTKHLPRMRQLVIPDRFDLDELKYSPLPQEYPSAKDRPKAIVVYLPGQVMGAYENGKLVRWAPISSGSDVVPTPEGFYHLNWRSKGRTSTEDKSWYMNWYFNFQNAEGRAFHELEMPGYPASHSCIRMLKRDAMWLYEWGEQWKLDPERKAVLEPGTPVFMVGQYDFKSYYPWRIPEWLAAPVTLPPLPAE